jgi:DnaK suppressor protein
LHATTPQTRAVAAVGPRGYNSALSRLKGTERRCGITSPRRIGATRQTHLSRGTYSGLYGRRSSSSEDYSLVAVKKPAKKAAKAAKKTTSPAAKTAARKPAAAKSAPKKAPAKPAAKKPVAKAPASKSSARPAAAKPAVSKAGKAAPPKKQPAKNTAQAKKAAPAKSAPAKSAAKTVAGKAMPAKAMSAKAPAAKSIGRDALAGPVKVDTPKQPQSTAARADVTPRPAAKPVAKPVARQLAQEATSAARGTTAPRPAGKVAVAVAARPSAPVRKDKVKVVPYKTDPNTGRPIVPQGYRPSPDEEYMGPLQVEYFRQRLMQWRADLVEESKQTIENLKDEVRDVGDEAERATRETENSLELRTRDRYRKLIGKIDSTLKRVDSGEYGYSVDSGEEIGLERLEARLTAERTIDEQERWEHLQKQIGD